jgi:hypothetical protein
MRRSLAPALVLAAAAAAFAQRDPLEGRWEGTVQGMGGERAASAAFKKEAAGYSGTMSGPRGAITLREVRLEGARVLASTEAAFGQGNVTIRFDLTLAGESLKGKADVDFSGQTFTFEYDLKRVSTSVPAPAAAQQPAAPQQPRRDVPQPIQQQSRDYFTGAWQFKGLARDSALGPGGPCDGTATFTPILDGKFLELQIDGKMADGPYRARGYLSFDPQTKTLTLFEQRGTGPALAASGDWSSPIAIRFTVAPIDIGGQKLQLRRSASIVAAHSFHVIEELSVNGGPFERLGNVLYTRAAGAGTKEK